MILRAYNAGHDIHHSQRWVEAGGAVQAAQEMLGESQVAYLHARSESRGCYLFRIDRA
ncbi:MAG: hypothetical protein NVS1B14_02700 [Vulcanimicrobiaceae bacterium]